MARYWLVKSEPETFSWDDLAKSPGKRTAWDGVRNYQARNFLRDEMAVGDGVLFYHSSADPPAVMGTTKVVKGGYPDPSQFDRRSPYYDPLSERENPRWYSVDLALDRAFPRPVPLPELRERRELDGMVLLRRGTRLSVQPVSAAEWKVVLRLGGLAPRRA